MKIEYSHLTDYNIQEGYYGWWLKDPQLKTYSLYRFLSEDFIRGFILAFDIYDLDFRKYSAGSPFTTKNNINIFHNIEGYDIHPLIKYRREPAPVGAYYTHSYEEYERTGYEPRFITDEADSEYPIDYQ